MPSAIEKVPRDLVFHILLHPRGFEKARTAIDSAALTSYRVMPAVDLAREDAPLIHAVIYR